MTKSGKPGPAPSKAQDNPVADRVVRGQPARAAQASGAATLPPDPGAAPVVSDASPQSHVGTVPAEPDARDKLRAKAKAQRKDG